jgi:hypothetical protein
MQGGTLDKTPKIWDIFPDIFAAISASHEEAKLVGHHDVHHAKRVGDAAYRIALEEWGDEAEAQLAGLAGLCHNADRIVELQHPELRDTPTLQVTYIVELITSWLGDQVDHEDRTRIIQAVLRHDRQNGKDDSNIQIALMDADRVINLDLDFLLRAAQFDHTLPTVDFKFFVGDPTATYRDRRSVLRSIAYHLEWVDSTTNVCVRTRLGELLARPRAQKISAYIADLREQLKEEGMLPDPL